MSSSGEISNSKTQVMVESCMLVVNMTEPSYSKELIISDSKDRVEQRTIIWVLELIGNSKRKAIHGFDPCRLFWISELSV